MKKALVVIPLCFLLPACGTYDQSTETEPFSETSNFSEQQTEAYIKTDKPESKIDVSLDSVLKEYFGKREADFTLSDQDLAQITDNFRQYGEITVEEMRPVFLSDRFKKRWNYTILSAKTSYSISEMQTENDMVYLEVYEWTDVDYTTPSALAPKDTFGYGVSHEMVLEKNGTEYSLVSDTYDEGPLTGMSSSLSTEEFMQLIDED